MDPLVAFCPEPPRIITIGNGAYNGNHNYRYAIDFWDFMQFIVDYNSQLYLQLSQVPFKQELVQRFVVQRLVFMSSVLMNSVICISSSTKMSAYSWPLTLRMSSSCSAYSKVMDIKGQKNRFVLADPSRCQQDGHQQTNTDDCHGAGTPSFQHEKCRCPVFHESNEFTFELLDNNRTSVCCFCSQRPQHRANSNGLLNN